MQREPVHSEETAGVKVLLVDDDQTILLLLQRLLAREAFQVLVAGSGGEGLEVLQSQAEIGVIVSDLKMPGMDGVRFLEQAKQIVPLAVRIILTGYADLPTTVEAINRGGASLFIAKPWEEQPLLLTLREAVRTYTVQRQNAALIEMVNRQNDELTRWNQHLEKLVLEQTAKIRQQKDQLQARGDSLQKLTDEFHAILNGIPDSLLHLSADLEIRWANYGAARRLCRPVEELVGQRCHQCASGEERPCPHCPALRVLVSGRIEDARITGADGRSWGVKVFPLKDREGRLTGLIEWASDITDKLVLRTEANLASRLAALGEMAAGVAHEVNNPNAVMLLNLPVIQEVFADLLPILDAVQAQKGDFPLAGMRYSEVRQLLPELLSDSLESAGRIRRIVEGMKDFVRVEKNGFGDPVRLNEVAEAAVRLVGDALRKTTGQFQSDLAPDLPPVLGSFGRLEQVVANLLMNACQALAGTDGEIAVATRFDRDRQLCLLEVKDAGKGISAEILPRICEPFFTTRRESGGTGLGLSVSNRIVHEHGGRLEFAQRPGGGTVVTVLLPCPQEAADG